MHEFEKLCDRARKVGRARRNHVGWQLAAEWLLSRICRIGPSRGLVIHSQPLGALS